MRSGRCNYRFIKIVSFKITVKFGTLSSGQRPMKTCIAATPKRPLGIMDVAESWEATNRGGLEYSLAKNCPRYCGNPSTANWRMFPYFWPIAMASL